MEIKFIYLNRDWRQALVNMIMNFGFKYMIRGISRLSEQILVSQGLYPRNKFVKIYSFSDIKHASTHTYTIFTVCTNFMQRLIILKM
jgi:hypothetical protein